MSEPNPDSAPHDRWVESGHCPAISTTKAWNPGRRWTGMSAFDPEKDTATPTEHWMALNALDRVELALFGFWRNRPVDELEMRAERFKTALERIAREDYRGSRPQSAVIAEEALRG